jgi:hypothetical protein
MSLKLKTTTTIKKGTIRPKTPHKTRGETMEDEISVVTEDRPGNWSIKNEAGLQAG